MTIFGKEPAVIIGFVIAAIVAVVQTALGQGLISDVTAGKITDLVQGIGQLLVFVGPLLAGILIRQKVTSPATAATLVPAPASDPITPEDQGVAIPADAPAPSTTVDPTAGG